MNRNTICAVMIDGNGNINITHVDGIGNGMIFLDDGKQGKTNKKDWYRWGLEFGGGKRAGTWPFAYPPDNPDLIKQYGFFTVFDHSQIGQLDTLAHNLALWLTEKRVPAKPSTTTGGVVDARSTSRISEEEDFLFSVLDEDDDDLPF
jgi:hypothetical protein